MVLLIIGIGCISFRGKITYEEFDSNKWKNSDSNLEENWSLRWDMMNSLRNNYDLVGMKKAEILKLLGNPDNITNGDLYYYLGYSHTGINTGSLTIAFSKGVVVSTKVLQG